MRNKLKTITALSFFLVSIWIINSCTKEISETENETTEAGTDLYEMAKVTDGFTWYKNSSSLLNKSSGSGHPQPFLRTRYNSVASAMLESNGKIMTGATFPEDSLIVKELYDNATTLGRYAILYKKSGNVDADAKGWVWGYI